MVFRLFWTLTRKTSIFTGKFLAGLSKLLFTCPEKHSRSNTLERKSWKLGDFRIIFEVFGTMVENVFQVWQNSNRCPAGTNYWKTVSKEKTLFFFRFWATFYFERKKSARFAEPAIYVSVEAFGDFFLKFHKSFTLLWNFFQKTSVGNFFSGLSQLQCGLLEAYYEEKEAFKTKLFLFIYFGVWANF